MTEPKRAAVAGEAYRVWAAAEQEAGAALRRWLDAPAPGRESCGPYYFTYLAALDREQAAAGDLQRLSATADRVVYGRDGYQTLRLLAP